MVPEDRKAAGLFPAMDLVANISATVMDKVSTGARYSQRKAEALATTFVDELRIATPSVRQLRRQPLRRQPAEGAARQMAGGRAEAPDRRRADARRRCRRPLEIYRLLRALADRGVALVVVSSDLPEVLALADRIIVMAEGNTVGEVAGRHRDRRAGR